MNWLRRLRQWWRDLIEAWREPLDVWGSDFPDGSDYPIPEGFDLRAMAAPLSFLDTFPGEQEDDK